MLILNIKFVLLNIGSIRMQNKVYWVSEIITPETDAMLKIMNLETGHSSLYSINELSSNHDVIQYLNPTDIYLIGYLKAMQQH